MQMETFKSYGKVNLYLKIGRKLKSGYHKIDSIMQRIDLHDILKFQTIPENKIEIETTIPELRTPENLVYIAAQLVKETYNIEKGLKIIIEKNLPLASGLGGGSSNAATTLLALNKMWKLKLKPKELTQLAISIGSDVPFFLSDEAAYVSGIGEKIEPIPKPHKANMILVNPGFKVSTKDVYKSYDRSSKAKTKKKPPIKNITNAMEENDLNAVAINTFNDFDDILIKKYPILKEIKGVLRKARALNATISGSGPTVFGMFSSIYTAREAYYQIKDMYPFIFLAKAI